MKKTTRRERLINKGWIPFDEDRSVNLDNVKGKKVPISKLRNAKKRHQITEKDLLVK